MTVYVLTRGGFGNVLFNYLVGYSIKKEFNVNVVYVNNYNDPRRLPIKDYIIYAHENTIDTIPINNCIVITEPQFKYTPISIPDTSKNYTLDGYFQSFKYSQKYLPELKTLLFDNLPTNYNNYTDGLTSIMLHVRRGDYLGLQHVHPVQTDEYYTKCLNWIFEKINNNNNNNNIQKVKILVFSDDINYVENWQLLKSYNHVIIPKLDEITTFNLMRHCDHFIISNSSFSLLAYYFRNNANSFICAPSKWFGHYGPTFDLNDLVPESAERFIY